MSAVLDEMRGKRMSKFTSLPSWPGALTVCPCDDHRHSYWLGRALTSLHTVAIPARARPSPQSSHQPHRVSPAESLPISPQDLLLKSDPGPWRGRKIEVSADSRMSILRDVCIQLDKGWPHLWPVSPTPSLFSHGKLC